MLYHLLYPLRDVFSAFNIFRYITFRATYATITALLICFVVGPMIIAWLRRSAVTQVIRADGPESHQAKVGTPTMGGLIILLAVVVSTILWAPLNNGYVLLALLAMVWLGALGFIDDTLKIRTAGGRGLAPRYKLAAQGALGVVIGTILYVHPLAPEFGTQTSVPFFKDVHIHFHWFYIPAVALVITGASNAVNLTDGLDGLAIGLVGIVTSAFALICYVTGRSTSSEYLRIDYLPGSGELTIFCMALLGASLGFLWFNARPAQVMMGDTGALALGGAIGTLAVLSKMELVLVIIGGVFVIEALSVIAQVLSFRYRHKRVLRMAPLHHHFELCGWPESKVVIRFWILGVLFALLGLSTFKIR